ncbi:MULTISPECIES: DUF2157 domain-containing protein [unclassified Bosea (in: a-proteobacteria)]|uniref:DUF2157 domain-containing protein n=1 Tax=unclassified Bosea (in: a-proteobacteria) TaxID=2653178 RepID=UPI000F761A23|nr:MULTISPECIES: DUF2157 domain-containing protein [unclassified Bosea (in: a-proteobacteria)]AZO77863.1 hypothetical protein BLM15_09730 [Bosea sp. Tri-49]RXT19387.1 hypothetical protein B5U98_22295 [Bosea sp. Tri-39]RXT41660.1 hypothetical protein B5U99_02345 [Bosea sp. Tri-54]
MLTGSYRKRLEADLGRWVGEGLVSPESATTIRRSLAQEGGGFKLPALLGLFGGLLIASSVSAFVAANWEEIPRLVKLAMVLLGVAGALGIAVRLESRGSTGGADAAATCGTLIFAAGVALVGQMYHLPTDWPGGALLIAIGALIVAFLLRSNGALVIALVAIAAWSGGRWDEREANAHLLFWIPFLPALWLAATRHNRLVHHLAVLVLLGWFATLPGQHAFFRFDYGLLAYWLAVSVLFVALGALALDRGGPGLLTACLPWGLIGLILSLNVELARILDVNEAKAGTALWLNYFAYALALPAVIGLGLLARERRFALPLALALFMALLVPVLFWSGGAVSMAGKIVVAALILAVAIGIVIAGAGGGVRRLSIAGSILFAIAIVILLWQTIGTLLDQSLFFLVGGALLIGLASGMRRLLAKFSKPAEVAP